MLDVVVQHFLERQHARHAVDKCEHDDAEADLQLRVLEQFVDDDLRQCVRLELDDDVDALAVGCVVDVADLGKLLVAHELAELLEHAVAIDLVRDLGDDDLALAVLELLNAVLRTDGQRPAAGFVSVLDAGGAHDLATRGEIGAGHDLHELFGRDLGIVEHQAGCVDGLAQVVGRNVRSHANCDARRAVDQQVRETSRQNRGFGERLIVVGLEIDRFLVKVAQQLHGRLVQARLGVTHGCSAVAIDRAEVAVTIDQRNAHVERLG